MHNNDIFFSYEQLKLEQDRPLKWYKDAIGEWAEFDARQVVFNGDARGKWARIRLDILAELKNPLFFKQPELAPELYAEYVDLLNREINKLNGGKNSYGSVPAFRFSKKARKADAMLRISR